MYIPWTFFKTLDKIQKKIFSVYRAVANWVVDLDLDLGDFRGSDQVFLLDSDPGQLY